VKLQKAPDNGDDGDGTERWVWTVRKNGDVCRDDASGDTLRLSMEGLEKSATDTSNNCHYAVGDLLTVRVFDLSDAGTMTATIGRAMITIDFQPDG